MKETNLYDRIHNLNNYSEKMKDKILEWDLMDKRVYWTLCHYQTLIKELLLEDIAKARYIDDLEWELEEKNKKIELLELERDFIINRDWYKQYLLFKE